MTCPEDDDDGHGQYGRIPMDGLHRSLRHRRDMLPTVRTEAMVVMGWETPRGAELAGHDHIQPPDQLGPIQRRRRPEWAANHLRSRSIRQRVSVDPLDHHTTLINHV